MIRLDMTSHKYVHGVLICIIVLLISCSYTLAQPQKWGDIDDKHLKSSVEIADSNASAVVLFDKGNLRLEDNMEYFLDRHVRIKLLSREGYKWGTVEIEYNEADDQEVEDLEAVTYITNGGKVDEYKVKRDAFFEKTIINDWKSLKFTFPALQPGCIIEYKYTLKVGHPRNLPVWYLDWRIPVKWNELVAEFPSFFKISKILKGVDELDVNEIKPFRKTIGYDFEAELDSYGRTSRRRTGLDFNGQRYRWVLKDREGIPDLPFMATPDNYKSHIQFQLTGYEFSDENQDDFVTDWSSVTNFLLDEEFAYFLDSHREYKEIISSLSLNDKSAIEKVRLIFNYMAESYTWDGSYEIYGDQSLEDILTSKKGAGGKLNLLLTGLLRQAGIEAHPVLLSTRENGSVITKFVLPNQFNHAIALVKLDGQELLLDASQGNRSLYVLPEKDLNGSGLVVKRSGSGHEEWVSLSPLQNTVRAASLEAKINPDGSLRGTLSGLSSGYFALKDRKSIIDKGEEDFIKQRFFKEFSEYSVSQSSVSNAALYDSILSFNITLDSATPAGTQVIDSTIYLDAVPIMKWTENPLKQENRKYPVDFSYPYSEQFIITYEIPAGYKVEEYPDRLVSRIADKGGSFVRMVNVDGNEITVRSVLKLDRSTYEVSEYARLKYFFDQIIEAHSEKIVLKKQTES